MSAVGMFRRVIAKQLFDFIPLNGRLSCQVQPIRNKGMWVPPLRPKPGLPGTCYRRVVHFKDKYTVEPLNVTNLAGRNPETGVVVAKGIGGGIKHKYHWIDWRREGPTSVEEPPKEEKVLDVFEDGCRTSHVALVGCGTYMKYILATENMKRGMIIKTSQAIPRNPVRAYEGDAYPLGALPIGTKVNCVEKYPGYSGVLIHAAGTCGIILRKEEPDRVIVQMPSKIPFNLDHRCMATVGRLSNVDHAITPIGSPNRNRELGNRPRSGLWQRKDGTRGRKIRPPPKVRRFDVQEILKPNEVRLTLVI